MDGTMRKILDRLPLAEGVLWLWGWIADDAFLDDLYQHWRGRSYEKVLTFPTFVHLIADALLKREGSARQIRTSGRGHNRTAPFRLNHPGLSEPGIAAGKRSRNRGEIGARPCSHAAGIV